MRKANIVYCHIDVHDIVDQLLQHDVYSKLIV